MRLSQLDFPRTDGSSQKWPVDKLDPTPIQNEVNFMRPIARDEPLCIKWRTQVGREVAKLLGIADHKNYILKDFPEGYRFYHHNKGPVADPRTDPYLYGSPSGRFRSPPEFIRHAYWLMTDETLDRKNCGCKYCGSSKQKQSEISQGLGIKPAPSISSNTTQAKPKVRPVAQPRKRHTLSGSTVNHDRIADLRASRRFRPGELVWCVLSPTVQGEHEHECIEFWPGLMNEARLKSEVLPHDPGKPWRVVQSTVYKVKLLGVMHSYVLPEDAVLPYQAYGPSMGLIERLRLAGDPSLLKDWQRLSEFRPIPLGAGSEDSLQLRFVEASTPFALAIQIAAHLVRMWTPTDEWKFHGEVPHQASTTSSASSQSTVEINETRHQGLWWGAERIWTDELVRLQPARAQVVPQGSTIIHRASPRADGRGVLMRINSIIAVSAGTSKDIYRECKVAGVLYELADEAYEEERTSESDVSFSGPSTSLIPFSGLVSPGDTLLTPEKDANESTNNTLVADTHQTSNNPINHPNLSPYPLPKPPNGFKFRPIMKDGYEIVLDVSLIAGRYYPELLKHPLLQNALADVNPDDARVSQLTALCGLLAGAVNSMECVDWAATRLGMIKHADVTAQQDLFEHWHPPGLEIEELLDHIELETNDVPGAQTDIQDVQMQGVET